MLGADSTAVSPVLRRVAPAQQSTAGFHSPVEGQTTGSPSRLHTLALLLGWQILGGKHAG